MFECNCECAHHLGRVLLEVISSQHINGARSLRGNNLRPLRIAVLHLLPLSKTATRLAAQLLTPSPTMANLPEDIQLEIFSWLPGKQVANLQTLSKRTCAGIRSPNFHLSQARRANTDAGFFVRDMNGQFRLFFADGSAGVPPSSVDFLNESRIQIVGSNEGLVVCLQEDGHLFIYNPLRKDTLLLGRPGDSNLRVRCATVLRGDGVDLQVVCFATIRQSSSYAECWVYSSTRKCWRMASDKVSVRTSNAELRHPVARPDGLVFVASVSGDYWDISVVDIHRGSTQSVQIPEAVQGPWITRVLEIGSPRAGAVLSLVAYNRWTAEFTIWDLNERERRAWEKRGPEISMAAMGLEDEFVESFYLLNADVLVVMVKGQIYTYDIVGGSLTHLPAQGNSWTYSFICPYANTLQPCEEI